MQTKIVINGLDITPWIKESGITVTPVFRNAREVVTLSGHLHRTETEKTDLSVQLVELRDRTLFRLMDAVKPVSTVEYTTRTGEQVTRTCYSRVTTVGVKKVVGGNTYFSGVELELEEK